jgi:putative peptidoglycan lipid II flippase
LTGDNSLAESVNIRRAIFGVSGIVIFSKLLGFIREMVIAERFGTSPEYDLFLIAIALPVFFNVVIVRAINFLTVPFLTKKLNSENGPVNFGAIWSSFNSLLAIVILLIVLLVLSAPMLVKLIDDGLTGSDLDTAVLYCRLISLLLLFGFMESFFRSALNIKKQFAYPVSGTIVLNIIVISLIYIFSAKLSVTSILLGLLIGSFAQILFLALKLINAEWLRNFRWGFFNSETKKLLSIGGTVVIVEFLVSTFFLIDRHFASDMASGIVSALNYGSMLVMLPVSVIGLAVASVTFPYLSERADDSHKDSFSNLLRSSLTLSLTIGLPCGIFYFMFARDVTAAAFFRGAFDLTSLNLTSEILIMLTPYLLSLFLYTLLIQAFYSAGYQKSVLIIAVAMVCLKYLLTSLFVGIFGFKGIPLATSLVYFLAVIIFIVIMKERGRLNNILSLVISILKITVASVPIIIIGYYYQTLPDYTVNTNVFSKFRVIPAAILSLLLFIGIGYILRITPVREILAFRSGKSE